MNGRGNLYIVATPIGNLGDITLRALEVLRSVDVIACEDARHTLKLLNHYEIKKHLVSLHARNEKQATYKVLKMLEDGRDVAYVSDAGTPSVSDPGAVLVQEARDAGYKVLPIPGVSALSALLSVAGCFGKAVHFEGFLSPKPGKRKKRLQELIVREEAIMLYESPYRMVRLLTDIKEIDEEKRLVVGKEMTKVHEDIIAGSVSRVLEIFLEMAEVKGEFAVLIFP